MDFMTIAKSRYSVRKYSVRKVEEEKLNSILEAGRIAPTGANKQPQRLLVVREQEGLNKLSGAANIFGAPLAIVVCGDVNQAWVRSFDGKNIVDIDTSIVTDHMMLRATELGLGTVWVCHFKAGIIKSDFSLPDGVEPVNILVIGYADGKPLLPDRHDQTRKPLNEIVFYESMK